VNQISANSRHFPAENIAPNAIPPPYFWGSCSFHVILEQSVHGDFEYIDNQLVGKIAAHFESFKLPKCALGFLVH